MTDASWTIRGLREALAAESVWPVDLAETALVRANGNQSLNTYLWLNPAWTLAEAARAGAMPRSEERRVGKECRMPCRSRWSPYH